LRCPTHTHTHNHIHTQAHTHTHNHIHTQKHTQKHIHVSDDKLRLFIPHASMMIQQATHRPRNAQLNARIYLVKNAACLLGCYQSLAFLTKHAVNNDCRSACLVTPFELWTSLPFLRW
jgi:hypothetical protein